MRDDGEWPVVIEAAIAFAKSRCVRAAAEPMLEIVRRGIRPDGWAPDIDLAVSAIDALAALGGQAAAEGIQMGSRETSPPAIRAAAQRARRAQPTCR
jgi:hypothetical protein